MRTVFGLLLVSIVAILDSHANAQELGDENLPSLFKIVKQRDDLNQRTAAIMQLAQFGPKAAPALPDLLDALQGKHEEARVAAAFTLGAIGEAAIEPVVKLIKSPNASTRYYAVWTLGLIGKDAKDTLPAVIGAMGDKDSNVRRKAAFALGRIGGDAAKTMAALAKGVKDDNDDVRESAGDALARLGKPAVPTLIGLLKSDSPLVFWQAAASLATIGPDAVDAVPALRDRLLAKESEHAKAFAHALAKIGTASLSALQAGFMDDRREVQEAAEEGLELLRADAVSFLLDKLRDKSIDLRQRAALSLLRMRLTDRQAVLAFGAGLGDDDSVVRRLCISGLSAAGPQAAPARDKIKQALLDYHPHVRGPASFILGLLEENVDDILAKGLKSKDARVRLVYATLMMERNFRDDRPLRVLNDGIEEKDIALRVQAAYGLTRDGKRVDAWIPIFVAGLKHKDVGIRLQAATGIRSIGEIRTGADVGLAEALADPDAEVREQVIWCLRLVIVQPETIKLIAKQFKDGDADRRIAMLQLDENRMGDLAKEMRLWALRDKDERVRQAGLQAIQLVIRGIGPVAVLDELRILAKDPKARIRIHVPQLLQHGDEKVVPLLVELLKDRDTQVRQGACSALTVMGDKGKAALPALEAALQDSDYQVRHSVVYALVKVAGLKAALPGLRIAAKDENGLVRITALHTLVHSGSEKPATLVPPLIVCLKDADASVRHTAVYALHFLGGESASALPLMREMAKNDPDMNVREQAGNSVAYIESMIKK